MNLPRPHDLRGRSPYYALILAAILASLAPYMRVFRWNVLSSTPTFYVTTNADDGPGSLRAAILDADHAEGRARIVVNVSQVTLTTALPPIVNPAGVALESGSGTAEISGTAVDGGLIDVAAPASSISNLRIVGGRAGVIVRAPGLFLSRVTVASADVGVFIGADSSDIRIDESSFAANRIGVQVIDSAGLTTVQGSRFEKNREAAIWAAANDASSHAQLAVLDSEFHDDGRGVVLVGVSSEIARNTFDGPDNDAIHASAARVVVSENKIRSSLGFGVYLQRAESGRIDGNDIANNCAGGIMLRDTSNAQLERNDIYQNGHGIIVMEGRTTMPSSIARNLIADDFGDGILLISASAVVSRNRVLRNRHVGLHISTLSDQRGNPRKGQLLLDQNVLNGNGQDENRDAFSMPDQTVADGPLPTCRWRRGAVGLVVPDGARP